MAKAGKIPYVDAMSAIAVAAEASAKAAKTAATAFRNADDRVGALWSL